MAIAKGKYILLLNSDTRIIDDALEKLVRFMDTRHDVSVVTPRLVYPDLSDQGGARTFPTPINVLFGRTSLLTRLFPNNRYSKKYLLSRVHTSDDPFEVDWVSGACMMLRKKVIDEVGPLDEKYFMYWEDVDLCFRIKQQGWKIVCVPEAKLIHYEGKSTSRTIRTRCIIEFNRGAYRYYRKYHIRSPFEIMNFVSIFGLTLRMVLFIGMNIIDTIKAKLFDRDISEHPAN
jgi:GT2 family glycosyltransferase